MLLVKVRVDKSSIHGFGVYSAERIKKGKPVWRFIAAFDLSEESGTGLTGCTGWFKNIS